jgi:hypothetical protein
VRNRWGGLEKPAGRLRLGRQLELQVVGRVTQDGPAERPQPLDGRRPGAQRRRPAEEGGLELLRGVVEQRHQQSGAVAEAAEDGPLAHRGRGGHRLHRDAGRAVLGDQVRGGLQQPGAVARRVGTQAGLVLAGGELQQDGLVGRLLGLLGKGGREADMNQRIARE